MGIPGRDCCLYICDGETEWNRVEKESQANAVTETLLSISGNILNKGEIYKNTDLGSTGSGVIFNLRDSCSRVNTVIKYIE